MRILIVPDINLYSDDESTNGKYEPNEQEDEHFEESMEEQEDEPMKPTSRSRLWLKSLGWYRNYQIMKTDFVMKTDEDVHIVIDKSTILQYLDALCCN